MKTNERGKGTSKQYRKGLEGRKDPIIQGVVVASIPKLTNLNVEEEASPEVAGS
jgi:hypothetical protein